MGIQTNTTTYVQRVDTARIIDRSAHDLTLEHLRAFVAEADRHGMPESQEVQVIVDDQAATSFKTIEIRAERKDATSWPPEMVPTNLADVMNEMMAPADAPVDDTLPE